MWSQHHRDVLRDLDALEEPTAGRRLDVGGFVLCDPFDEFLRNVSEDYLRAAWERLTRVLEQSRTVAKDLSWGWMHPGETGFRGETGLRGEGRIPEYPPNPSHFVGWTSCELSDIWRSDEDLPLDEALKFGEPCLRCTCTWRSLKWKIAPNNFSLALKLVESICVDDISDWHPDVLLGKVANPSELWLKFAVVIRENDQRSLNLLLERAEREYTSLGFRILVRGYTTYVLGGFGYEGSITLPEII